MRKINYLLFVIFFTGCASVQIDKNKNYISDVRDYIKFQDYKKAVETAQIIINNNNFSSSQKEEALYWINEAAENIVLDLKRKIFTVEYTELQKQVKKLKENLDVNIILKKIGYEYIIYYDKEYYFKLKSLNPNSPFLKKIEYRYISRISRFATDYVYRYKEIETVIKRYKKLYESHPEKKYIPLLLMRIADLYLYLYEQGPTVKKELNLTNKKIKSLYEEAKKIYKLLKKKYPDSMVSKQIAYVIESVRLRHGPTSKAKVIKRIPAGTMVKIIDRTAKKFSISNMYDYWYKVKLISGLEGWVYGFYLRSKY